MTADRIDALEALLSEAASAHAVFERTELNGVYDQDWPRWYASYAVDHGIGELLGRPITADELAGVFTSSWEDIQKADPRPAEPWATLMARRLAEEP
jgi:hypothetical protein